MAVGLGAMQTIIKEGMDAYWKAVHSPTDEGLGETELCWKRAYVADTVRWKKKFGPEFDRIFGKAK